MKRAILFYSLFWIVSLSAAGQSGEFTIHENGLIYDETSMFKLGEIVDSLNLKFRNCTTGKPVYSFPQGIAYYIKKPSARARKLMQLGISFDEFSEKFDNLSYRKFWVIKSTFVNDENDEIVRFLNQ